MQTMSGGHFYEVLVDLIQRNMITLQKQQVLKNGTHGGVNLLYYIFSSENVNLRYSLKMVI